MNKFVSIILLILCHSLPTLAQINWYKWSEPTNLEILNSPDDDFAPQFNQFENTLYFNSTRTGKSIFFKSEVNSNNEFAHPYLIEDGINSTMQNQSYISFINEELAYFTSFNKTQRGAIFNIFESRKQKNTWQKGTIIENLKTDDFRFHPTVSPNRNFIIFAQASADNPDDSDLWIAYRNGDNSWGGFLRLDALNTNKSEITPFLASNDTLYFASNGFSGKGGFDIYYSINIDGIWQKPRPLADINTEYDESDFATLPNNTAIFASNRPNGLGKLDLWLTRKMPIKQELANQPSIEISTYITQIRINEEKYFIKTPLNPTNENFAELFRDLINNNASNSENMDNIAFSNYDAIPEILEVNLQMENADSTHYWKFELVFDTLVIYEEKGYSNAAKLQIDLNKIAKDIKSDNLILHAKIIDKNGELIRFENQSSLLVFKSQKETPFNLKNNAYSHSYLFAYPNDYSSDWIGAYRQYFEQIRKQNPLSNQIEVLCSQNLSKSEQNELINQLKTIFQNKRIIKHNDSKIKELPLFLNQISCKYYIIIM